MLQFLKIIFGILLEVNLKNIRMSNVKKPRAVKPKKQDEENKVIEEVKEPDEAPKKRGRTKKQLTKEEKLKLLSDASNELKQIMQDLKEDESRIQGLGLKRVPELVKETIKNLDEDIQDMQEEYEELSKQPAP